MLTRKLKNLSKIFVIPYKKQQPALIAVENTIEINIKIIRPKNIAIIIPITLLAISCAL